MAASRAMFNRTELLLGSRCMDSLAGTRVIVFGVGGVGSWAAESLVRSGVGHIVLVDSDRVCVTNVNRQSMATMKTVGQVKVEALKSRLLEVNPNADVVALQKIYSSQTAADFSLSDYDYVIDSIDSLKDKAELILNATAAKCRFFSSMGAALRVDATKVATAEFWKIKGDPLAAALRRKFRHQHVFPARKFACVYSQEPPRHNLGANRSCGTGHCVCPKSAIGPGDPALLNHEWCSSKAQINGTLAHITAIFGFMLAGLVVDDVFRSLSASGGEGQKA